MRFSRRDFANLDKLQQIAFARSIIDDCQGQLPRIVEALGCGNYGCAFLTDRNSILKFTGQEKEGKAAGWIMATLNAKEQVSLPSITNVWALEDCHPYDHTFYFIEREPLNDLQADDPDMVQELIADFEGNFFPESAEDLPSKAEIIHFFSSIIKDLSGRDQAILRAVADLYIWLCQRQAWLDDIMIDNWGQRLDETPVIRDLGALLIF